MTELEVLFKMRKGVLGEKAVLVLGLKSIREHAARITTVFLVSSYVKCENV